MMERRELLDSNHGRSSRSLRREMGLHDERVEGMDYRRPRHLVAEEKGFDSVTMRGYGDEQSRNIPRSNDQGYPIRDNDTASKFQWMNLLKESGNSIVDGREGSRFAEPGRRYEGLVERSTRFESEMISDSQHYAYVSSAEYHRGGTRSVSGHSVEDPNYRGRIRNAVDLPPVDASGRSVEDPNYRGHIRNVVDLPAENARGRSVEDPNYRGHVRNVVDLPAEDSRYYRHSRNVTDLLVEDALYDGHTRNVTGLSVANADLFRHSRTMSTAMTDRPVEDVDLQSCTRSVASPLVDNSRRSRAREYPRYTDREVSMRSYEEHNCCRFRYEDRSHSLTPHAHSNGQLAPNQGASFSNLGGPQSEVYHHLVDGSGIGGSVSPSNCCNSPGIVYSRAGTNTGPVSCTGSACPRAIYNPDMGGHVECNHPESQRSGKVYRIVISPDLYANCENVQDYHDHRDQFENDTLDPALLGHDYVGNSRNYDRTLREEPIEDMDDLSRIDHYHTTEYVEANMQPMSRYPNYGDETMLIDEERNYDVVPHGMSHEEKTWNYPILAEGASDLDEDAHQSFQFGDIDSHNKPKRIVKRKRGFTGNTRLPNDRTSTLDGRGSLSYGNRYSSAAPDNELGYPHRSSSYPFQSKANARMSRTEPRLLFGGLSKELQSRLSKPSEPGSNSVKKRLNAGFVSWQYGPQATKRRGGKVNSCVRSSPNINYKTSASPPDGQAQRTSVKKRLKEAPHMEARLTDPQVSHLGCNLELQETLDSKHSGTAKESGALKESDPDHSILKVKPTEKDPPDNSKELKHLVDHWFIKCMLYLNANPGRHKKFKEQGKAGTLKCSICSSSKEFIQTKDVAMHAFTSPKVGLRAPHLGFHRALCVLMGWDPAFTSNGRWVCKSLPDVEARAMKEDLILWPPVVIIHNGSAGHYLMNEPVKISFEELENTLKDMCLSEGKTTISNGNIRLVKFNGTLSGFQEAERLHNVFAKKKHGRAELLEVDGVRCSEGVAEEAENRTEDAFYGYLGIVEDFGKLNYDLRRHCVARSKKEILASAGTAT